MRRLSLTRRGLMQAIEHPRAVDNPSIVRMDSCYSMWRSRTIPDPKGSNQPACETVLLHQEQFKIPENMARFAVRHGMAGFVKKLGPEVKRFVAERRQRCMPVIPPTVQQALVHQNSVGCEEPGCHLGMMVRRKHRTRTRPMLKAV